MPLSQGQGLNWVDFQDSTMLILKPVLYRTYYSYVTKLIVESNQIQKVIFCDFFFLLQSLKPFFCYNNMYM